MSQKLQPARGTHDIYGQDLEKMNQLIQLSKTIASRYGYQGLDTPIFENTTVFQKTLGETSDIVGKEMYTFLDRGGESMTLRPEGTAPAVRAAISLGLTQNLPLKLYYYGPMFRYERPQQGRTRQFSQFGIECLGVDHPCLDAEVIAVAYDLLKELELQENVVLELNSLGDAESRFTYRESLVSFLMRYKNDLSEDSKRRLETNPLRILDSKDQKDQEIVKDAPLLSHFLNAPSKDYYEKVKSYLRELSIPYQESSKLVRGLDYYNHTIFEFVPKTGHQGTLIAGGRYNGLMKSMGGPDLSGIGWAYGVGRLMLLMKDKESSIFDMSVIPLDDFLFDEAFKITQMLRAHGKRIDFVFSGNLGKRLKRSDRLNIPYALLLGGDEWKNGNVILKNLKTGEQKEVKVVDVDQAI